MSEIRVEDLSVTFGRGRNLHRAVDGVGFHVQRGRTIGIVGESGSGKTTVARVIAGLQPPTSGEVTIGGTVVRSAAAARAAHVQMVFQNPYSSLNPRLRVGSSLLEVLPAHTRRSEVQRNAAVAELLDKVRLAQGVANKFPHELSGGMRQRVAVARALAVRPHVLVADEVTSALDVSVQGAVINMLRDLQRDLGFTMVFISHNLAIIGHVSDQIAVMYRGRLLEHGDARSVLREPAHNYTRLLLASVPREGGLDDFHEAWARWVESPSCTAAPSP